MAAFFVFPNQLFAELSKAPKDTIFYFIESEWYFRRFPIHQQKVILLSAAMQALRERLLTKGYRVEWMSFVQYPKLSDALAKVKKQGVVEIVHYPIVDGPLALEFAAEAEKAGILRLEVESPFFISGSEWLLEQFATRTPSFADFYAALRIHLDVLIDSSGKPVGGRWIFGSAPQNDALIEGVDLPLMESNRYTDEALIYTRKKFADYPGSRELFNYPVTHNDSLEWLDDFLEERLANFGEGSDQISAASRILHHSGLSALLNIGLLTPRQVMTALLQAAERRAIPLVSLESAIRHFIGWREYMYGVYISRKLHKAKTIAHPIPQTLIEAQTGLPPVDTALLRLMATGYLQPAERTLLGVFLTLLGQTPTEITHFFMTYAVDAYEWVVIPNVTFVSTRIYSVQHLLQVSDYPIGSWVEDWKALYWHYIHMHKTELATQPRQASLLKQYEKMYPSEIEGHVQRARKIIRRCAA